MNKSLGIGFIDLLTGFFSSTIILMLIYSFTKSDASAQFETTDSYFLLEIEIPKEELKLRFNVGRFETSQKVGNKITSGEPRIVGGFQELDKTFEQEVYIWGPVKSNKKSAFFYKIYVPNIKKEMLGNWQITTTYYDDLRLSDVAEIKNIINSSSQIKFNLTTKEGAKKSVVRDVMFGEPVEYDFQVQ